ncbi:sugar phosphate isomerase/epimerase family protein [Roseibium salinum]|uniref:Sugar phosphate isomerase/epimerase n=1 Tax=Roseibium salinum TaxID=1604349 RepID=A0ABT3R5Z0_9HYPH|nr:sugar phosphate isomerase/epimerase [Roseibium sp. DSM 29163]MCX2724594.1 sugar phosphate isomerase/epimerase [Roseibium sp. DSM 29163]
MNVSFQLYSAREFTPWETVLERLAKLGYTQVEGFGGNYEDPAAFRKLLDANGLAMPSGHFFPMEQFEDDINKVIDTAGTLGMNRVFCPALPPDQRAPDADRWQSVAERLEAVGEKMRGAGLRFGWHNHDFEFKPCADGRLPMDILLTAAPSIEWEADIAWIVRGGQDPLAWIERHADRITTAHVKDIASAGECVDEDGWADVGHGTLDWKGLMGALRKAGVDLFVMEHDKPSDFERFASRSIQAFRTY